MGSARKAKKGNTMGTHTDSIETETPPTDQPFEPLWLEAWGRSEVPSDQEAQREADRLFLAAIGSEEEPDIHPKGVFLTQDGCTWTHTVGRHRCGETACGWHVRDPDDGFVEFIADPPTVFKVSDNNL